MISIWDAVSEAAISFGKQDRLRQNLQSAHVGCLNFAKMNEVSMVDAKEVYGKLQQLLAHPDKSRTATGPGVYAVFARDADCQLPLVDLAADQLLYIGKSKDLREREHFNVEHSGFSTLRRSLGALLKAQLELSAIPRGTGMSNSNFTCYRFTSDGERRLGAWMRKNIVRAAFPYSGDINQLEKELIGSYCPPLNLQHWQNPIGAKIKRLRSVCKNEAVSHRPG